LNRDRGHAGRPFESNTSMPSTPSTLISEALNALSKATNSALANVEDHARTQVERANAEVMEARAERDDALKLLHELELEQKELQRRAEGWKAAVEKSELTIKHQTETISHLRAEVQQWKTQLQRLEEASRQELLDWKEQYLRAEQERCRLSGRIDELVAEQLAWNTQANATLMPVTPRTPYPEPTGLSAASTATKRASTSSIPPSSSVPHKRGAPAVHHEPPLKRSKSSTKAAPHDTAGAQQLKDAAANNTAKPAPKSAFTPRRPSSAIRAMHEPPSGSVPRQQVIRHVRAVIQVPVKEEEYSDEDGLVSDGSDASGSAYDLDGTSTSNGAPRRPRGSMSRKKFLKALQDEDDSGDQADRSNTNGRSRQVVHIEDDDVDELAMGAEDDADDEYLPPQTGRASVAKIGDQSTVRSSAQKRKLHAESNSTGRRTTTKTTRKR